MQSPTRRVPSFTITVETAPLPLSSSASTTTPFALLSGDALSSSISAWSRTSSSSSLIPFFFFAETSAKSVSPPHCSDMRPISESSLLIFSISAPSLSTLFIATMIGTPAALAWLTASTVWGITPSSAATTRMTISVMLAPRALIEVNASCPGVSTKTMVESFIFTA